MFYYPNVLQRHSGCFSTVWLAATKGIRVSRRELLRVNVKRTCWEIVDYVTAQVPPPQPNLPRPRFSLYLSSQLQYGVVVVYHRQCGFLLEEVQQAIARLLRYKKYVPIDMAESDRLALDAPQQLHMMEGTEGAQDPFFGLMVSDQLPSPYNIPQVLFLSEENSLVPSGDSTLDAMGFRSPPAGITLREREHSVIAAAEYFEGDDFPEATAREIDLLLDQPDQFRGEEGGDHQAGERTVEAEGPMSFVDQLKETTYGTEQDKVWLLDEGTGQPTEVPMATIADLETTPQRVAMPTPPSGTEDGSMLDKSSDGVIVRPLRKPGGGRRRQLVFADPEIQISEQVMKEQIGNPLAEILELSALLLDIHFLTKRVAPGQLFSAPCGSLLHDDLMSLWKQKTTLPQHGATEEEEEGSRMESEQDREILRAEMRKRTRSGMKEFSSEGGFPPAEASSVSDLELSKDDRSLNDVVTPVTRWSLQEDTRPMMEPIAEENIVMPEAHTYLESVVRIGSVLQSVEKVTFDALLPPMSDRLTAAHMLSELLELLSAGQATVSQAEPYSSITVHPAVTVSH
ncbi:REC8 meiotic recombination protein b isoform X2 [Gouania willdenowi]|uniref:Uncharacterized protein n=1 Tax=Gouania willdenowi TaxID=441366 RepID=A0A8C5GMP4_GOUWI|nr:meiotic recombination protein REC8 homolog isoform X2 [Gouania willdenowi]